MTQLLIALLIAGSVNSVFAAQPVSSQKMLSNSQVILERFDLPDTAYHKCGMSIISYAPNSISSRHRHHGPKVGYVLEGELTLSLDGQPKNTVKVGDSFQIPADAFHTSVAGPQGAKILATWVLKEEKARSN